MDFRYKDITSIHFMVLAFSGLNGIVALFI